LIDLGVTLDDHLGKLVVVGFEGFERQFEPFGDGVAHIQHVGPEICKLRLILVSGHIGYGSSR